MYLNACSGGADVACGKPSGLSVLSLEPVLDVDRSLEYEDDARWAVVAVVACVAVVAVVAFLFSTFV